MFAVVLIFVSHDPRGQFPEKDVDRRSQVLPCSKNKCRFNHYHVAAENLTPPANWAQANVDSIIMWLQEISHRLQTGLMQKSTQSSCACRRSYAACKQGSGSEAPAAKLLIDASKSLPWILPKNEVRTPNVGEAALTLS